MSYLLASLIGLSLGLLGSGGSALAVPILKYAAGLSAKQAVATSLATVGAVAVVGSLLAWRQQRVAWKEAFYFSIVATAGTYLGVKIAGHLSDKVQMGIFILAMAYAVYRMVGEDTAKETSAQASTATAVLKALAVGVLTGVVGVGGGFLIVPALVALFGLSMKKATGTSLVVIAANSFVGTLSYSGAVDLDWRFTMGFSAAAVCGLVVGMHWSKSVPEGILRKLFAGLVALVCVYTLYREFFV